ncbi:hypothetical protein LZ30DRAFT_456756 [Colletotrichum cereale]|nr:hypothetical protein LZ30DRAFT_456756 [Colletotrichum cereale]
MEVSRGVLSLSLSLSLSPSHGRASVLLGKNCWLDGRPQHEPSSASCWSSWSCHQTQAEEGGSRTLPLRLGCSRQPCPMTVLRVVDKRADAVRDAECVELDQASFVCSSCRPMANLFARGRQKIRNRLQRRTSPKVPQHLCVSFGGQEADMRRPGKAARCRAAVGRVRVRAQKWVDCKWR